MLIISPKPSFQPTWGSKPRPRLIVLQSSQYRESYPSRYPPRNPQRQGPDNFRPSVVIREYRFPSIRGRLPAGIRIVPTLCNRQVCRTASNSTPEKGLRIGAVLKNKPLEMPNIIAIVPHDADELDPGGRIILKPGGQHPDFEPSRRWLIQFQPGRSRVRTCRT